MVVSNFLVSSCADKGSGNFENEPKFYSADTPGKWVNQESTHLPQITQTSEGGKSKILVSVPLTQSPGHYIEVILLTDANHKELAKKSLKRSELPTASFDAPGRNYDKLYVVIKCNLHDMWETEINP